MTSFEAGMTMNRIAMQIPDSYMKNVKEDMKKIELELVKFYQWLDNIKERRDALINKEPIETTEFKVLVAEHSIGELTGLNWVLYDLEHIEKGMNNEG